MITVIIPRELGYGLTLHMQARGWFLYQDQTGRFVCEGEGDDPQRLIDEYNPWPYEKAAKLAELNAWFESAVAQLTAGTTQSERDSWPVQVNEAYGIRPLAMLPAMASARGITTAQLIEKVKAKAEAFAAYYGAIQGRRDAIEDQIKAFPDAGELHRLPDLWAIKCTD
ncbi:MAG: hypothetical protein ACOVN2_02425 [Usitatibacteraceae bacterium]